MMKLFMMWLKKHQWRILSPMVIIICYGQVHTPANERHTTTSTVTRESRKESNTKLIITIVVIVLVLSAICVCTIYMLQELFRFKSEIASINTVSLQTVNASLLQEQINSFDVLQQQINDLAGILNTSIEQIQVRENEKQQITNASLDMIHQQIRYLFGFHPNSCSAIFLSNPSSPSGYFSSNGSAVRVYCDMTLSCGGVTGGWMRVANLDMRDSNTQCPGTLRERMDFSIRTCETPSSSTCSQITYSTENINFVELCGKIKAYQVGIIDGFSNSNGADGIILFYGSPRQHIWTFVAAQSEVANTSRNCPCTNSSETSSARSPPAFVGNDYFCDTGS